MADMLGYAIYLLVATLYVYALYDCVCTPDTRIRVLPKAGWLLPLVGAIAWQNLGKRPAPTASPQPEPTASATR
ncbi:hypothetical protein ACFQLX_14005 [Streptomyces polyrhachis]|uniref:Cardiolipin synthase N-terminal domain-containing protein n=1 Tax=Streptomyces polyrhachis TaxID=1282885 RepID=A0ABW2GIA2_9ACTN